MQEGGQGVQVEGPDRHPLGPEQVVPAGGQLAREQRQVHSRRTGEAAEGIGLGGPVQPAGSWGVTLQVVLGAFVVREHRVHGRLLA